MAESPIREHFRAQIGKGVASTPPGFSEWLQPKMISVEEDSLVVEFVVRPEMCNPVGTLHGGIHSAILDEVIGMTVAAMGNDTHFCVLKHDNRLFACREGWRGCPSHEPSNQERKNSHSFNRSTDKCRRKRAFSCYAKHGFYW